MHKVTDEKTCLNCDNFRKHYIKGSSDMFSTNYGHCNCYAMKNKLIKISDENTACKLWRPLFEPRSEYERILAALEVIKKRLDFIGLLLKDE